MRLNFWPCTCDQIETIGQPDKHDINCVNLTTIEIANVFNIKISTPTNIEIFRLKPSPLLQKENFLNISANLLGLHKINILNIACWNRDRLVIDPGAFSLSGRSTRSVHMTDCDLEFLDLSFLAPFVDLIVISIHNSFNIGKAKWAHMPPLPALSRLIIEDENPLNSTTNRWAYNLPPLTRGLETIQLFGIGFSGNVAADRIFQWLLNTSAETLEFIQIGRWSNMTRFPRQLSSFKKLNEVIIECQNFAFKVIETNSIAMNGNSFKLLAIKSCGVQEIHPGAFAGILIEFEIVNYMSSA